MVSTRAELRSAQFRYAEGIDAFHATFGSGNWEALTPRRNAAKENAKDPQSDALETRGGLPWADLSCPFRAWRTTRGVRECIPIRNAGARGQRLGWLD